MKPSVQVLCVGSELLNGSVVNTNAAFLGRELSGLGFEVVAQTVCADSQEAIRFRLGESLRRAEVIFMVGGLGPTPDDVTREGIAAHFNVPLIFSEAQYRRLKKIYRRFGKRIPALVKREALYPENAKPLINRFGIALGFSIEVQNRIVIALPGVPSELQNMYYDVVLPLLKKKYPALAKTRKFIVKMAGISEPDVMTRLGADFFEDSFDFGIYPEAGEISIRISADKAAVLAKVKKKILTRVKDFIYAAEDISFSEKIGDLLLRKRQTLAVAESCTGGLLASKITRCSGASAYFVGGTVAYHRTVKIKLGVSEGTLRDRGEVSREVAAELAKCVRLRMEAGYGIGITGIAGPGGGTAKKPVGLVFIGLASPDGKVRVWKHLFWGERNQVQERAAVKALEHLWRMIR
ncbi:MAG TPA: CinA family nicotinamide mononucleotide deamidase-related protein [Candidatus Omnitrophota bacterium]|nr:CinA family nicotinamide mononucleotide deamidase-related protein [Candidatus Omnitrophota bacterium]HPS37522.1 CinA family nicotinamide mononucleotide deamidase-related protein [Candidatus Omnitrophota bacterium]